MTSTPVPSTHAPDSERRSEQFVSHVLELCENNRTKSDLRSGLGLPVERCNRMHRYLVRRLPEAQHRDARRAHYGVAALIAARPPRAREADAERAATADSQPSLEWRARPNLGASLAAGVNAGLIRPGTAESHLHLFSRQSSDALHQRLPALTRHLLGGGINVDWAVLLEDLTWWNRDRDTRATRWMDAYYRALDERADADETPDNPTDETNSPKENH
ncbi:type I-E CRISPR-associated protein Cse2/CasB [Streptomyces cavernae]|uniref:type I-E CRISPR-associated protein Cse2/CasB n=1 Tax=Streptomyces cavernae TaxID=2259034 RepID=UPI000FEBB508|nr:type I-E CRISPR-associated protein Cse2/CasB [Streptomyces cavernae]